MIDITMTATIRPAIIEQTLESFKKRMFKDADTRLIINIDPIGREDVSADDVLKVCEKYFKHIVCRQPKTASFPAAFKWVWQQIESDLVFHLEDDWILLRDIDLQDIISVFTQMHNYDLAILRLPWKRTDQYSMKNWKVFYPYFHKYFECPAPNKRELGFCGHPSFIRSEFIWKVREYLSEHLNPEKQFHSRSNTPIMQTIDKYRFGVYGYPNQTPAIADIGRAWMIKNKLAKAGNKAFFTVWKREGG